MNKPSSGSKTIAIVILLIIGAAAGFGYLKQSTTLGDSAEAKNATTAPVNTTAAAAAVAPAPMTPAKDVPASVIGKVLETRPGDIILGDVNAGTTIVEYMSLSCSHCAHFHQTTLPDVEKEFIATGKAKLVIRHFPLNEPAIKAAQLVECAGQNGLDRKNFVKVLFEMQTKWAFDDKFLNNLKQIASVGGIDSAAFDSCMADKALETKILAGRKEAEDVLKVDSTPGFFINGKKFEGERDAAGFRKILSGTEKPQK